MTRLTDWIKRHQVSVFFTITFAISWRLVLVWCRPEAEPSPAAPAFNWIVAVAALVLIVVDRIWKKLPSDHLAIYREPALIG